MTVADGPSEFAISPDGKFLAYQYSDERTKRAAVVVKPIDAGEPVRMLTFPELPVFRIEQWTREGLFCISADSTRIILLPVDGKRLEEYFKTSDRIFSFAFSPDGKRLALSRGVSAAEAVMITDFKDR